MVSLPSPQLLEKLILCPVALEFIKINSHFLLRPNFQNSYKHFFLCYSTTVINK